MSKQLLLYLLGGFSVALSPTPVCAQDDVADIKSEDLRAGGDENARYFLIGPRTLVPKDGYGLLIVLPGGSGGPGFHPFVKRIFKYAVPKDFVLAQPVAKKWTDTQVIVWPTETNPVKGMKFSTEKFVAGIIKDVSKKHKLNPRKVLTLSWSSGGPAAYAISLTNKTVTGSFIAMSVFKRKTLPPLKNAKGHAYFLYHSPDDRICPYRMAEHAAKELKQHGATTKLTTYKGGHGWRGNLYKEIRQGLKWINEANAKPMK